MLRHALNWVQQRRLQPAISALGSKARAVHTLLQDRKSSLQTRTLWLPGPHGDREGCSDWTGGTGAVCAWSGGAAIASASPRMRSRNLAMDLEPSPGGWPNSVREASP